MKIQIHYVLTLLLCATAVYAGQDPRIMINFLQHNQTTRDQDTSLDLLEVLMETNSLAQISDFMQMIANEETVEDRVPAMYMNLPDPLQQTPPFVYAPEYQPPEPKSEADLLRTLTQEKSIQKNQLPQWVLLESESLKTAQTKETPPSTVLDKTIPITTVSAPQESSVATAVETAVKLTPKNDLVSNPENQELTVTSQDPTEANPIAVTPPKTTPFLEQKTPVEKIDQAVSSLNTPSENLSAKLPIPVHDQDSGRSIWMWIIECILLATNAVLLWMILKIRRQQDVNTFTGNLDLPITPSVGEQLTSNLNKNPTSTIETGSKPDVEILGKTETPTEQQPTQEQKTQPGIASQSAVLTEQTAVDALKSDVIDEQSQLPKVVSTPLNIETPVVPAEPSMQTKMPQQISLQPVASAVETEAKQNAISVSTTVTQIPVESEKLNAQEIENKLLSLKSLHAQSSVYELGYYTLNQTVTAPQAIEHKLTVEQIISDWDEPKMKMDVSVVEDPFVKIHQAEEMLKEILTHDPELMKKLKADPNLQADSDLKRWIETNH